MIHLKDRPRGMNPVKYIRQVLKLSIRDFAGGLDMSYGTIATLERGGCQHPHKPFKVMADAGIVDLKEIRDHYRRWFDEERSAGIE